MAYLAEEGWLFFREWSITRQRGFHGYIWFFFHGIDERIAIMGRWLWQKVLLIPTMVFDCISGLSNGNSSVTQVTCNPRSVERCGDSA